jgi:nitrogen fixation protein NifU and related proteins
VTRPPPPAPPAAGLYHATILDRDRHPRCYGPLPGATHVATLDNPLCGDVVTMRLVVETAGGGAADEARVVTAAFEGRGCAVSRAAASLWTELLPGRALAEVAALIDRFAAFVVAPLDAPLAAELGELVVLAGVRAVKSRRGCATLASRALAAALAAPAARPPPDLA